MPVLKCDKMVYSRRHIGKRQKNVICLCSKKGVSITRQHLYWFVLLVKPILKYHNIYLPVIAYSTDTLMRQHEQKNISCIYFFTL